MKAKLKTAERKLNEIHEDLAKSNLEKKEYSLLSSKLIDVKEIIRNL